jgi:hypothetical protein
VQHVLTAEFAELFEFQLGLLGLLVARGYVIALIAIRAGKDNIVTHVSNSRYALCSKGKTLQDASRRVNPDILSGSTENIHQRRKFCFC